ncbi:MAG: hypothetical protein IPO61_14850 [Gammaproteobacteria bacterium]|nr:hypothetical protein [Gammaproteobacteria bacterium]
MKRATTIFVLCVIIFGCYDKFYGPKIRNGYSQAIEVSILYDDGTRQSSLWPSCRTAYLGQENRAIREIIVKVNGQVVHKFDRERIQGFLEAEKRDETGRTVWTLSSSGIHFSSERECPIMVSAPEAGSGSYRTVSASVRRG